MLSEVSVHGWFIVLGGGTVVKQLIVPRRHDRCLTQHSWEMNKDTGSWPGFQSSFTS